MLVFRKLKDYNYILALNKHDILLQVTGFEYLETNIKYCKNIKTK